MRYPPARLQSPFSNPPTRLRVAYVYREFSRSGSIASLYTRTLERLSRDVDVTAVCGTRGRAPTDAPIRFLDVDSACTGDGRFAYAIECSSFARRATRAVLRAEIPFDVVHAEGFASVWADVATAHAVRRAELDHYFEHVEPKASIRRHVGPRLFRPQGQVVLNIEKRLFASPAPIVISPSQRVKDDLRRYHGVPGELVSVIPYGIDTASFRHSPGARARLRAELGVSADTLVILSVGDEFERKGISRLIDAMSRSRTPAELWVIGGDDPQEYHNSARAAGLADRVRFLGRKPYGELPQWYAASDVVAMISRQDSWTMPVIEGMAAGRAALASEFAGSSEALTSGENGFVVARDGDPAEIATLLDGPLADPSVREAVGTRAATAAQRYDVEIAYSLLLDVYRRAAERRRERPMPDRPRRARGTQARATMIVEPERAS